MGVLSVANAHLYVQAERNAGRRVVFTNGVFDLLHTGHVRYLEQARSLGDTLIVGLNSDASTRALKGAQRPLIGQAERAELVAALRCVDAAVIFDALTASSTIDTLRPDLYVKGGDYKEDDLPEAPTVRGYGGEVCILLEVAGRSTTNVVEIIRQRFCP